MQVRRIYTSYCVPTKWANHDHIQLAGEELEEITGLRRVSDGERLSIVETEIKNLSSQITEVKTTNARIEQKLEQGIAGLIAKLDVYAEIFLPRKEYTESIALRDDRISALQRELVRIEAETKTSVDKLETRIETEITRVDKDVETVQKEQIGRVEQERSDRRRNRPHWFLVAIGAVSLLSSIMAVVIAAHHW